MRYEVDRHNRIKYYPVNSIETPASEFAIDPTNAQMLASVRQSLFITPDDGQDDLLREMIRTANYRVRDLLRREITALTVRDNYLCRGQVLYLSNVPTATLAINYFSGDSTNYGSIVSQTIADNLLTSDPAPARDNSYFYDRTNNRLVWSGTNDPTSQLLAEEHEYPVYISYASDGISGDPRILDAVQKYASIGFAQRAGQGDIPIGPTLASLRDTLSPLIRGEL